MASLCSPSQGTCGLNKHLVATKVGTQVKILACNSNLRAILRWVIITVGRQKKRFYVSATDMLLKPPIALTWGSRNPEFGRSRAPDPEHRQGRGVSMYIYIYIHR